MTTEGERKDRRAAADGAPMPTLTVPASSSVTRPSIRRLGVPAGPGASARRRLARDACAPTHLADVRELHVSGHAPGCLDAARGHRFRGSRAGPPPETPRDDRSHHKGRSDDHGSEPLSDTYRGVVGGLTVDLDLGKLQASEPALGQERRRGADQPCQRDPAVAQYPNWAGKPGSSSPNRPIVIDS